MCKRKSRGTKSGQRKSTTYNESLTHVKVKGANGLSRAGPQHPGRRVKGQRVLLTQLHWLDCHPKGHPTRE